MLICFSFAGGSDGDDDGRHSTYRAMKHNPVFVRVVGGQLCVVWHGVVVRPLCDGDRGVFAGQTFELSADCSRQSKVWVWGIVFGFAAALSAAVGSRKSLI